MPDRIIFVGRVPFLYWIEHYSGAILFWRRAALRLHLCMKRRSWGANAVQHGREPGTRSDSPRRPHFDQGLAEPLLSLLSYCRHLLLFVCLRYPWLPICTSLSLQGLSLFLSVSPLKVLAEMNFFVFWQISVSRNTQVSGIFSQGFEYPLTRTDYENNSLRIIFVIVQGNCTLEISGKERLFPRNCASNS